MIKKIAELKKEIKDVKNKINNFELDPSDFIESYNEMLDEIEGEFMGFYASRILEELDPIAYTCGLHDYVGSFDIEDSEEYQDLVSQLEELEFELEDLEEEPENLSEEDEE